MVISASDISKRYSNHWILRNFNFQFEAGNTYAIQGPNGSGKSTLLKIISGFLSPTEGVINYSQGSTEVNRDEVFHYVSIWGPYVSLLRELKVEEMVQYYLNHKSIKDNLTVKDIIKIWDVDVKPSQLIKALSSGQAQRLGLVLAILTTCPILILDEPTSFLDENSKKWFFNLLHSNLQDKVVIIASNDEGDFLTDSILIDMKNFN